MAVVAVVDESPEQLVADVAMLDGGEAVLGGRKQRQVTARFGCQPVGSARSGSRH